MGFVGFAGLTGLRGFLGLWVDRLSGAYRV